MTLHKFFMGQNYTKWYTCGMIRIQGQRFALILAALKPPNILVPINYSQDLIVITFPFRYQYMALYAYRNEKRIIFNQPN